MCKNVVNFLGQDSVSHSLIHALKLIYREQSRWGEELLGLSGAREQERRLIINTEPDDCLDCGLFLPGEWS